MQCTTMLNLRGAEEDMSVVPHLALALEEMSRKYFTPSVTLSLKNSFSPYSTWISSHLHLLVLASLAGVSSSSFELSSSALAILSLTWF